MPLLSVPVKVAHGPHRSPEKSVQINKHTCSKLWLYYNVDLERKTPSSPFRWLNSPYLKTLVSRSPKDAVSHVVLEKKSKMWKVYRRPDRQTPDDRCSECSLELTAKQAELNAMLHGIKIFTNTCEVTMHVKRVIGKTTLHKPPMYELRIHGLCWVSNLFGMICCLFSNCTRNSTARLRSSAVAQWARAFASQAEGCMFESKPQQT